MILILENAINWNTLDEAKLMILKGKQLTENTGVPTLSKFQIYNLKSLKGIEDPDVKQYCIDRMLDFEKAKILYDYGVEIGQDVFFSVMYPEAVQEICEPLGVKYYKVRYYDRKNWKIHLKMVKTMKKTFISLNNESYRYIMQESTFIPLFCVPKYPAKLGDYKFSIRYGYDENYQGISDHTPNLELLKICLEHEKHDFFERHTCLTKENCLEAQWASTFDEIQHILEENKK